MTEKNDRLEVFGSRLRGLGGRVAFNNSYKNTYIDIEEFFLDATHFVFHDSRLAQTIENWIYTFGFIISPAKVKSLINKGHQYDSSALAVFCEIINHSNKKQINTKCLEPFFKRKSKLTPRNKTKLKLKIINPDPLWRKYNISTPAFKPETKKYILDFDYINQHIPEIKNRILGINIVDADYQAYLAKEGKNLNLNKIAARIHAYYSNLHKVHTRLETFNPTLVAP